jgi:hypothetical protein
LASTSAQAQRERPGRGGGGTFTLFGNAEVVELGRNQYATFIQSDINSADTDDWYGGIEWEPRRPITFAELRSLQAAYQLIENGAGGGAPRFQIGIDEDGDGEADGNVFVYIGTPPNFDDDPVFFEVQETGELIGSSDLRYDTSQVGGTFYDDYAGALELVGDLDVVYVDFVVDAGWAFPDGVQSTLVYELKVDRSTYTTPKPRRSRD